MKQTFQMDSDKAKTSRWRHKATNGELTASIEVCESKAFYKHRIVLVKKNAPVTEFTMFDE